MNVVHCVDKKKTVKMTITIKQTFLIHTWEHRTADQSVVGAQTLRTDYKQNKELPSIILLVFIEIFKLPILSN